uniref:ion channel n=1 Tax=Rhizobium sp. F40D2 TaxID=3453141 RepID=UPI003F27C64C
MIVIMLIAFWALGLTIGAALIIRPELGAAIRPSSGGTPTDFMTALLVAGNSLSIVGGGDYSPHTSTTRILFLANSLIGASVLSLMLSYLVQVYSALRERNALALTVDLMTGCTGDAAQMLARLGPDGDFSNATSELSNLARLLAMTKEAHHFYPLLFYFRFREPFYSVSRFSFILLDLTTLIETTLDRQQHSALVRSAPVVSCKAVPAYCSRRFIEISRQSVRNKCSREPAISRAVVPRSWRHCDGPASRQIHTPSAMPINAASGNRWSAASGRNWATT